MLVSAQTQNASFLDTLDDDGQTFALMFMFLCLFCVLFSRLSCKKDESFLSLKSNSLSLLAPTRLRLRRKW